MKHVQFDKVSATLGAFVLAEELEEQGDFFILFWFCAFRFADRSALSGFGVVNPQKRETVGTFALL